MFFICKTIVGNSIFIKLRRYKLLETQKNKTSCEESTKSISFYNKRVIKLKAVTKSKLLTQKYQQSLCLNCK